MWLAAVEQMGFRPTHVVLRSRRFVKDVRHLIGTDCIVSVVDDWAKFSYTPPEKSAKLSVLAFVDGRLTGALLHSCESRQIPLVLGLGKIRRGVPGWDHHFGVCCHHLHGGVTTTKTNITTCLLREVQNAVTIPDFVMHEGIPRDMSTLLSSMVSGRLLRTAPAERHLDACEVRNLRDDKTPVYHGGGWLPPNPKLSTRVLTPYALGKGRWVNRCLEPVEYLQVYDVPELQLGPLSALVIDTDFPALVPGKSLLAGASGGFEALRGKFNGGEVFFPFPFPFRRNRLPTFV